MYTEGSCRTGIDASRWAIVGALLAAINCGPNEMLIAFFSRIFCPDSCRVGIVSLFYGALL